MSEGEGVNEDRAVDETTGSDSSEEPSASEEAEVRPAARAVDARPGRSAPSTYPPVPPATLPRGPQVGTAAWCWCRTTSA